MKKVGLIINDGEVIELDYKNLDFLRKYFYVVRGGEHLESVSINEAKNN